MLRTSIVAVAFVIAILTSALASQADEPKSLLQRVSEWQYPGSTINGATMSDAATVNAKGERTVPSTQCRTVLTTTDSIAKVVTYYKSKLTPNVSPDIPNAKDVPAANAGRSVTYHEDSSDRPVAVHLILVNTNNTSTTLVITRAKSESLTHIAWTQYVKH